VEKRGIASALERRAELGDKALAQVAREEGEVIFLIATIWGLGGALSAGNAQRLPVLSQRLPAPAQRLPCACSTAAFCLLNS